MYLVVSNTSKTRKLVASSDATSVPFVNEEPVGKSHRGCWTNIVSTLLLLGIRSLNALLAHSIAVNTSYRSSLGITNPGIQALRALDLV
jgi:hypothetical protein